MKLEYQIYSNMQQILVKDTLAYGYIQMNELLVCSQVIGICQKEFLFCVEMLVEHGEMTQLKAHNRIQQ